MYIYIYIYIYIHSRNTKTKVFHIYNLKQIKNIEVFNVASQFSKARAN